jgi:hypothetical protein
MSAGKCFLSGEKTLHLSYVNIEEFDASKNNLVLYGQKTSLH